MLPDNLAGSYKRYKEDTSVFATWLSNVAANCGYNIANNNSISTPQIPSPPSQPSARLKGKARKDAKKFDACTAVPSPSIGKRTVTTKEILVQAELVVKHKKPPVKMPYNVWQVLQRAIGARKRCAAWFRNVKNDQEDEANSAHEHFIGILEKALDILKPCVETSKFSRADSSAPQSAPVRSKESTNRYGTLMVEDIGEEDLDITAASISITSAKSQEHVSICQLEVEVAVDLPFVVFCFFEDLQRIQMFLGDTWKLVAERKLDHVIAAVITNLAFSLVRETEDEFVSLYSSQLGQNPSYQSIASILLNIGNIEKDLTQSNLDELKKSPYHDFIYYSTFLVLRKYQLFVELDSDMCCVIPMSFLYDAVPELLPDDQDWIGEDEKLSRMLLYLENKGFLNYIQNAHHAEAMREFAKQKGCEIPDVAQVEDELTKFLHTTHDSRLIRVSVVFIARAFLDIIKPMNDNTAVFYTELRQRAATADATLGIKLDRNIRSGVRNSQEEMFRLWVSKDMGVRAILLASLIRGAVKENSLIQMIATSIRHKVAGEVPKKEFGHYLGKILPSDDPAFLYNHNPVYCGLESLRIAVRMEKEGVNLCNEFGSLFAVTHLYNAMQRNGLLDGHWNLLEHVITTQVGQLFNGALPITNDKILRRFLLRLGFPLEVFAKNHHAKFDAHRRVRALLTNLKDILKVSPASEALLGYLEGTLPAERFLGAIEMQVRKPMGLTSKRNSLTRLQILTGLRELMPEILSVIEIPYITLTRKCNAFLLRVNQAFEAELGVSYRVDGADTADYQQYTNVITVWDIMIDAFVPAVARERHALRRRGVDESVPALGHRITIAARIMNEFLDEANRCIKVEPFAIPEAIEQQFPESIEDLAARLRDLEHNPEVLEQIWESRSQLVGDH